MNFYKNLDELALLSHVYHITGFPLRTSMGTAVLLRILVGIIQHGICAIGGQIGVNSYPNKKKRKLVIDLKI